MANCDLGDEISLATVNLGEDPLDLDEHAPGDPWIRSLATGDAKEMRESLFRVIGIPVLVLVGEWVVARLGDCETPVRESRPLRPGELRSSGNRRAGSYTRWAAIRPSRLGGPGDAAAHGLADGAPRAAHARFEEARDSAAHGGEAGDVVLMCHLGFFSRPASDFDEHLPLGNRLAVDDGDPSTAKDEVVVDGDEILAFSMRIELVERLVAVDDDEALLDRFEDARMRIDNHRGRVGSCVEERSDLHHVAVRSHLMGPHLLDVKISAWTHHLMVLEDVRELPSVREEERLGRVALLRLLDEGGVTLGSLFLDAVELASGFLKAAPRMGMGWHGDFFPSR